LNDLYGFQEDTCFLAAGDAAKPCSIRRRQSESF
jgi:hypothetical protein